MGNWNDGSPIHQTGDTGEAERAASLIPEELSESKKCDNSSQLGEKHGGGDLREGQALKDVKRERSMSTLEQFQGGSVENSSRMDPEVAKYASNVKIHISKEENKRLRKMIDVRILTIMVFVSWRGTRLFEF
jgi:hypothetical protein